MRVRTRPSLALAAALILSSAACSGSDPEPTATFGTTEGPAVAVTYARPADVLAMVLPATGAQARLTQGYGAFQQAIVDAATRACLASRGAEPPDGPPPMFIRFNDIPDLDFIASHGFTVGPVPRAALAPTRVPAGGTAPPTRSAEDTTQRACLSQGAARIRPLRALTDGLRSEWLRQLSEVDAADDVRTAYRSLPTCLRQRGVQAADEDGFFRMVDVQVQAGAGEHDLAVAYATCMRPIEAIREPLRARVRDRVVAARPAEASRVRQELLTRIADDEKRYGIRLCFPVV